MQRLELSWEPSPEDEGEFELRVTVDGEDLNELARRAELADAERDGQSDVAGGYSGLRAGVFREGVADHYLGGADSHLSSGPHAKTVLIGCVCGDPGCWPLMARIELGADEVRWVDFEQPHRKSWSYGRLDPLTFERGQYEAALDAADRSRPD